MSDHEVVQRLLHVHGHGPLICAVFSTCAVVLIALAVLLWRVGMRSVSNACCADEPRGSVRTWAALASIGALLILLLIIFMVPPRADPGTLVRCFLAAIVVYRFRWCFHVAARPQRLKCVRERYGEQDIRSYLWHCIAWLAVGGVLHGLIGVIVFRAYRVADILLPMMQDLR